VISAVNLRLGCCVTHLGAVSVGHNDKSIYVAQDNLKNPPTIILEKQEKPELRDVRAGS
jgi:hypothetical protein